MIFHLSEERGWDWWGWRWEGWGAHYLPAPGSFCSLQLWLGGCSSAPSCAEACKDLRVSDQALWLQQALHQGRKVEPLALSKRDWVKGLLLLIPAQVLFSREREKAERFAWGRLHFSSLVLAPAALEHGHFGQSCGGLKLEKRAKSPEWLNSTYSSISPTSQMHLECMCSVVKINVSSE